MSALPVAPRASGTGDRRASGGTVGHPGSGVRGRRPSYASVVRQAVTRLWRSNHRHVLDIGAGDGTLAQCVYEQLGAGQVTALDVTAAGAAIGAQGVRLPYTDGAFDAATLNDVVARIAPEARVALFRELLRTTTGPLYIKGRVARAPFDRLRVVLLGGGLAARPLSMDDWHALADASGWRIAAKLRGHYRHGLMARLFPNRLEIAMRWER